MSHVDYKKRGTNSYAQYFDALDQLGLGYAAKEEAFRRMAFNVMSRNCDDHSKNFSFRLRKGRTWEICPGYDITFAHNPLGVWTNQHLMSVNGKFKDINGQDLLAVADRFEIGSAKRLIEEVSEAIELWPAFAAKAGLAQAASQAIGRQHIQLRGAGRSERQSG
jgi:serine/threonine-protein kinase HipA